MATTPEPHRRRAPLANLVWVTDGCDTGLCGAEVPPLVGSILTGTGMTLDQAVAALVRGDDLPLTAIQRRIVEERAAAAVADPHA